MFPYNQPLQTGTGRLHIFPIGTNIADQRKTQAENEARIGRLGDQLLETGHGVVSGNFTDNISPFSKRNALEAFSILKYYPGVHRLPPASGHDFFLGKR